MARTRISVLSLESVNSISPNHFAMTRSSESGLPIEPVYDASSLAGWDPASALGEPGSYQYSRRGELIRCPWHGWEFDLRTGKSWCEPDRTKVRSYELKVEPGGALVEGELRAETFPVSIEKQYIVVEV